MIKLSKLNTNMKIPRIPQKLMKIFLVNTPPPSVDGATHNDGRYDDELLEFLNSDIHTFGKLLVQFSLFHMFPNSSHRGGFHPKVLIIDVL